MGAELPQPPPAPSRYVVTTGLVVSPGQTVTSGNRAQLQGSISCILGDKSVFKKLVRIGMLLITLLKTFFINKNVTLTS